MNRVILHASDRLACRSMLCPRGTGQDAAVTGRHRHRRHYGMTQENGSGTAIGAGQVAIVTGGARGIGIATATLLAQRGYTVVVADIDGAVAEEAAQGITA